MGVEHFGSSLNEILLGKPSEFVLNSLIFIEIISLISKILVASVDSLVVFLLLQSTLV